MTEDKKCYFCNKGDASSCGSSLISNRFRFYGVHCDICGDYVIDDLLTRTDTLEKLNLNNRHLNFVSKNIELSESYTTPIWCVGKHYDLVIKKYKEEEINPEEQDDNILKFDDYKNNVIYHHKKPSEILKIIGKKLNKKKPFEPVFLDIKDIYKMKIENWDEFYKWADSIAEFFSKDVNLRGYVKWNEKGSFYLKYIDLNLNTDQQAFMEKYKGVILQLNVKGWKEVEKKLNSKESEKVLIAVDFEYKNTDKEIKEKADTERVRKKEEINKEEIEDKEKEKEIKKAMEKIDKEMATKKEENKEIKKIVEAIKETCDNLGWKAFTIDEQEYLGGIPDRIKAEINESRFIIADFSKNNHNVYYESGYAEGKDKQVIYICNKTEINKVKFDIKHLNHILYKSNEDLKRRLTARIEATIGNIKTD